VSTRTSTVYTNFKEHYPVSKEHCIAREHGVGNPCPTQTCTNRLPTVVVEWLALLFRIRVVRASNLGTETGYSDLRMFVVSSVAPGKFWDSTLN
jgi:hypothetical protein